MSGFCKVVFCSDPWCFCCFFYRKRNDNLYEIRRDSGKVCFAGLQRSGFFVNTDVPALFISFGLPAGHYPKETEIIINEKKQL